MSLPCIAGFIESTPCSPLLINVPDNLVSYFVTRKGLLDDIFANLLHDRPKRPVILLGMGGVGKTQLVLDLCRQAKENTKFKVMVWIDATSPVSVMQSYKTAAKKFSKCDQDMDDEDVISLVKDNLSDRKDPWLLVFDNYDNPKAFESRSIRHYIPSGKHSHILFTSRHADTARLGHTIEVSNMREMESLELLLQREPLNDEEIADGHRVASVLGYLALALDQAGAYIRKRRMSLRDFVPDYQRRKDLILQEIPDEWEYCRSIEGDERETRLRVFTTWELSYQQISGHELDKMAKDHLLMLAAFFDTKLISAKYFQALFDSERPEWMELYSSEGEWDISKLRDVLAEFRKLSLLQLSENNADDLAFSIHPVVRDWIILRKHKDERQHYAGELITALTAYLKGVDIDLLSLETKQETVSHVDVCIQHDAELLIEHPSKAVNLSFYSACLFAKFYGAQGRYDEAEELYGRALAGSEEELGPKHPKILTIIMNLGNVYRFQGRYNEAKELYERALAGSEETLGPKHLKTLTIIMNLGNVYLNQGRYGEAEELYGRALAGSEEELGPKHPDTLKIIMNLGNVYLSQSRYNEAEKLYKQALIGREEKLGAKHPDILRMMESVAIIYGKQGQYNEAEKLFKQVLIGREEKLGAKHPDTLSTVENLAIIYANQGRYNEAEELCKQALIGMEEKLGVKHPDTLGMVENLAIIHERQGRYDEAEELYKKFQRK